MKRRRIETADQKPIEEIEEKSIFSDIQQKKNKEDLLDVQIGEITKLKFFWRQYSAEVLI